MRYFLVENINQRKVEIFLNCKKKIKQMLYRYRCIGYRGIRFNVIEMFNKYKEENTPSQAKLVVEPGTWRGTDNPP